MMKDGNRVTAKGKMKFRMLSVLMALVLALSILPIGAMAASSPMVKGENDAISVKVGLDLQMIEEWGQTVTWSVYDVEAGNELLTQTYASIEAETGLLTGIEAGTVRVTATDSHGDTGSKDITVVGRSQVGALSRTLTLQGGSMVTLAKTKFNGIAGSNTFYATSGQESAEPNIYEGTLASSLLNIYSINISNNPFVPASVGQTISVIEVDADGVVVGFGTFTVSTDGEIGTNKPPVAIVNEKTVVLGDATLNGVNDLFKDPEGEFMNFSNFTSSNTDVVIADHNWYGSIYNQYLALHPIAVGTATVSLDVTDATGDKIRHTMEVTVRKQAPYVNDNETSPFTNTSIGLTFEPNSEWVSKITAIEVNGEVIQPENYTITNEKQFTDIWRTNIYGEILFHSGVLLEGKNRIVVKADGYTFVEVNQDVYNSEDSYNMTTLVDQASGGITATAKVLVNINTADMYNVYDEQGTAVFQLMDGDVPVSTVSYTVDELNNYSTFKAHFNLADISTNVNYSVRAFLISGESIDSMGYNLATGVTQAEFDELFAEYYNGW
ncbi:hypothetical protein J2T13_001272 [Paenibacillus sp. DS2015]|uniref:hemoblobin-interacting domain-containing protein n=1 Tax=Paenibacillus sp. DS2015 TaxID=3373917 RepID=UPI003D1A8DD3